MVELEEDGLGDEEYVPHELAANVVATEVDCVARTAVLKATLPDGVEKKYITW